MAVPAPTPTMARTETAALPPRPAEPEVQPDPRLQLAAQPPATQPERSSPKSKAATSAKGNRIAPTVAKASPSTPPVTAVRAPAPAATEKAAPPQPAAAKLDADELAMLMKRSEEFIGAGDFASARIVLRRAAESGHAGAALALAGTYDPAVLERFGVKGMAADPAQAKYWYEKAREMGSGEARNCSNGWRAARTRLQGGRGQAARLGFSFEAVVSILTCAGIFARFDYSPIAPKMPISGRVARADRRATVSRES